ncbi:hypothetical protein HOR70_gp30 [Pectobacterium phage PPWS4]|uniref:Uncharacterized protein n=3 Tax=Pektosvirus TaxID=2732689 RepID=A0A250KA84_9CAUD|nr:putative transmembrane protein [Pectobacterium phage PP81]YP_009788732.1 putative transmembrane protein [Pectobacterium phage PP47]YP_009789891.1 hypothetical protein HOR70_gp30 [Pectobacterium phage PPWS4]AYM47373.1 putative transmembrane protein [Pectobacterium phage PP47]AYM47386.1 putative transmembrane protein [Pectobacterium phage PP81]BBA26445.1 hypothetical protein [Pectobacterium phage PPWS4]
MGASFVKYFLVLIFAGFILSYVYRTYVVIRSAIKRWF